MTTVWTTLASAVNRADSQAHDAQRDIDRALRAINKSVEEITDASTRLRAARVELHRLEVMIDEHGRQHEIPFAPLSVEGSAR